MRTLKALLMVLFGEIAAAEIVDGEIAMDALRREREQAWAEESLPTFANAHGCVNCGVLQIKPKDGRCALCGSSHVISLHQRLMESVERVDGRRHTRSKDALKVRRFEGASRI